jgi:hypothetical protein
MSHIDRAEVSAEYLEKQQWGKTEDENNVFPDRRVVLRDLAYKLTDITAQEVTGPRHAPEA